jgi:ATP-binding cassette subfamily C exporter for protease/lipase
LKPASDFVVCNALATGKTVDGFKMKRPLQQPRSELAEAIFSFRKVFVQVGALSAVINLLMVVPSVFMMQVYDRAMPSQNITTLVLLSLIALALYGLMELLEFARSRVLIRIGNNLDMQLNSRVFNAAFERNLTKAGSNPAQALNDLTSVRQFLTGNALFGIFDGPWAVIFVIVTFMFHWILGLFVALSIVILLGMTYITESATRDPLSQASQAAISAGSYANTNLRNAEVIEAMGMLPALRARWFEHQRKLLKKQTEASDKQATIGSLTKFIRISMQSMVLGVGSILAINHEISPGMMIAGSILMGQATRPVEILISAWKQMVGVRAAYARLEEMLKQHPARFAGMSLPKPEGQLSAENVIVTPPGSQNAVLRGLSFTINPGDVVGIVGPSASGKSTLARLMVGIWPAQAGKMRLDGADVYQWNKDELGPHIGYLPQDIELFEGSIAENIARFGEIDSEKVIQAARRAGVHEMILRFPRGYDTKLGDGGSLLSGGQKQRIGLARAMYGDPSLIVLDEPNSNLDEHGEQALVRAVLDLKAHGKTVILITHRTSALSAVDKMMVLQDGMLQLYGPRDQVLAALMQATQQQAAAQAAQQAAQQAQQQILAQQNADASAAEE